MELSEPNRKPMKPLHNVYLLADRNLFKDMGSGFRDKREHFDASDLFLWFGIVIGVFVVIGIIAKIVARRDKRQLYNSPRGLFRALCRAHGLDRPSRRLLARIARAQELAQPGRLFLEPERYSEAKVSEQFREERGTIELLRKKIFQLPAMTPAARDATSGSASKTAAGSSGQNTGAGGKSAAANPVAASPFTAGTPTSTGGDRPAKTGSAQPGTAVGGAPLELPTSVGEPPVHAAR